MGDLSKNFSKHEFVCDCTIEQCSNKNIFNGKEYCLKMSVDAELIKVMQEITDYFAERVVGKAVAKVTSGYRCDWWNGVSGGSKRSKHTLGVASDFCIIGVDAKDIYDYADKKYAGRYGIGLYINRIHIDVRKNAARW